MRKTRYSARGDRFLERIGELLVHELEGKTFLEIAHHARLHLAEQDQRLQRRAVLGGDRRTRVERSMMRQVILVPSSSVSIAIGLRGTTRS